MARSASLRRWSLGLVVVSIVSGCERARNAADVHPNPTAIAMASAEDRRIDLSSKRGEAEPNGRGDWLGRLPRLLAVGALDQPPEQVFGQISAVAIDDERVFVLDGRLDRVLVFLRSGKGFQVLGRAGQGPGEFSQPRSLVLLRDRRLLVGDAAGKIHWFAPDLSGRYAFDHSVQLSVAPESMCEMSDLLYVHGMNVPSKPLIHVYSLDGNEVAGFGEAYNSGEPMVDMQFSTGQIACAPRSGTIYYASSALNGEVRAFDTGGTQLWRSWLDGFAPPRVLASPGGLEVQLPPNGFDRLVGLTVFGDSIATLQVAHVVPEKETEAVGGSVVRITTIFIPPPATSAIRQSSDIPRIGAVSSGVVALLREEPFPRLELVSASIADLEP